MRVLFDHNVPKKLRSLLPGHYVITSREMEWDTLKNGDLMTAAEDNRFEAMVTGDKKISHQQNLYQQKRGRPQVGPGGVADDRLGDAAGELGPYSCRAERSDAWKFPGGDLRCALSPSSE